MEFILSLFIILFVWNIFFCDVKFCGLTVYGVKRVLIILIYSAVWSIILGILTIGILYIFGVIWKV